MCGMSYSRKWQISWVEAHHEHGAAFVVMNKMPRDLTMLPLARRRRHGDAHATCV